MLQQVGLVYFRKHEKGDFVLQVLDLKPLKLLNGKLLLLTLGDKNTGNSIKPH